MVTEPGTFSLAAFLDRNHDLNYDPGEPGVSLFRSLQFTLATGESREGIEITIDADSRIAVDGPVDITALRARSAKEQIGASLGQLTVLGEVADLRDPKFGAESGKMGMWRPLDFAFEIGAGIYFAEPYDRDRIPVLFGHPGEFAYFLERLDRTRFQPWFYFYPSGAELGRIVEHLEQTVATLQARHRVDRIFVVAHSMGGLVSRGLILEHAAADSDRLFPVFVSLSTPWGGDEAAAVGVERAPAVVPSWRDMAPGSPFLRGLFYDDPDTQHQRRELPKQLDHYLLFGFRRDASAPGESSDGVVAVVRQLHPEAQADAHSIRGFDATHTGILRLPEASDELNRILAVAAD
jgi:pimeloyl-ACP methyl ester carboxylesterase